MTTKKKEPSALLVTAERLADVFSMVIQRDLTQKELDCVRKANDIAAWNGSCATHDFIDANVAMEEAFHFMMGRDTDLNSDSDLDLWNDAWAIAKVKGFTPHGWSN